MLYDTLQKAPAPGSPLEVICMYVFSARQRAKYMETLCNIQPHITKDNLETMKKLLDSYEQELFPFKEKTVWKEKQDLASIMEREMAKGPLMVESQQQPKRSSKKS